MPDKYHVVLRPSARRDLDGLDFKTFERLRSKINILRENPRPAGTKKLADRANEYRLRVGDYRILYEIVDKEKMVRIFRALHRREAYR